MADVSVTDRIALRAAEMRKGGVYLGLLEWVAFAAMEKVRVIMLFGDSPLDVLQVFAPAFCQGLDPNRVCRVVAVRVGRGGVLLSAVRRNGACFPDINHYVIGKVASQPLPALDARKDFSKCARCCAL